MASSDPNAKFTAQSLFGNLDGKVALVTGGGTGIGLMAVQALVANGAKVYIVGRTKEKLDKVVSIYGTGKYEGKIIPLSYDVSKKDDIVALVKDIESREKCLCILVNNAGIDGATFQTEAKSAEELKANLFDKKEATFEDWTDVYRTNVPSLYFLTSALLPLLANSTKTHDGWSAGVVNITSISGQVKSPQHHFAYNASKAAALHVTRMFANTLAENDIRVRVNSLSPGVFPSEMTTNESGEDQKSHIPAEKYADKVPAHRPGKEEDMAQTVLYIASNQYLNGQDVTVDGGYTLSAGR